MVQIFKGTNYWRLLCIILISIILGLFYYLNDIRPKKTEEQRLVLAEEILLIHYWIDLSNSRELFKSLLQSDLPLNAVNDELYVQNLDKLRVLYNVYEEKSLAETLQTYLQYSNTDMNAVKGLCLQIKFVKEYSKKIKRQNYSTEKLRKMQEYNANTLDDLSTWFNHQDEFLKVFKQYKMIADCSN